jgi:hypothetical protein
MSIQSSSPIAPPAVDATPFAEWWLVGNNNNATDPTAARVQATFRLSRKRTDGVREFYKDSAGQFLDKVLTIPNAFTLTDANLNAAVQATWNAVVAANTASATPVPPITLLIEIFVECIGTIAKAQNIIA